MIIGMKFNQIIIAAYLLMLICLSPFALHTFDTYYYWDWSRHLDFSYYDGSPMIAYCIRLSTLLFGDTLFALSFVSIGLSALTAYVLYKTARVFLNKDSSYIALAGWLFSPLVTLGLLKQTTYDNPVNLFWMLTLYYTVNYIQREKPIQIYGVGVMIGLMLLSKYTGCVLALALLVFLAMTPYRRLFKSIHLYGALGLSALIFSPVLWWNYQHDWISFTYQLSSHQCTTHVDSSIYTMLRSFVLFFIPTLNFMLLPMLWYAWHYLKCGKPISTKTHHILFLCFVVCNVVMFFYLFASIKVNLRYVWLCPLLITSALLSGYWFQCHTQRRLFSIILACYFLISVIIKLNDVFFFKEPSNLVYLKQIQEFNHAHPEQTSTVLTSDWMTARILFFLKNKPLIYTLKCEWTDSQNQYALWSEYLLDDIKNNPKKDYLVINLFDSKQCLAHYFSHCYRMLVDANSHPGKQSELFIYKCHA